MSRFRATVIHSVHYANDCCRNLLDFVEISYHPIVQYVKQAKAEYAAWKAKKAEKP